MLAIVASADCSYNYKIISISFKSRGRSFIYIGPSFKSDTERLGKLFELYIKMMPAEKATGLEH